MNSRISIFAWTLIVLSLMAPSGVAQSVYEPYTFTTLAGTASVGSADGVAGAARFNFPKGVAVDGAGNLYMADTANSTVRKLTPTGVVTTLAGLPGSSGSADGTGAVARFSSPSSVAEDSFGNVYVSDTGNFTIRRIAPNGMVTTLAGLAGSYGSTDGTGNAARFGAKIGTEFFGPEGIGVDGVGNVYVADRGNNTIRKITPNGAVTTLAGRAGTYASVFGPNGSGAFGSSSGGPVGLAVDSAGNVYVADNGNNDILKVTPNGAVTLLAGMKTDVGEISHAGSTDGTGNAAQFSYPNGVAVDSAGNVYVADLGNNTIRKVTVAGVVITLAGLAGSSGSSDGVGSSARFWYPAGVAVDGTGNIYVADAKNNTIRKVTSEGAVTTLAGQASYGSTDGVGSVARLYAPNGVVVDDSGNAYVADSNNHTIRKITPSGVVTTLAGQAGSSGNADGTGSVARFYYPRGVAVDSVSNIYVADTANSTIRKVTPAGVVTTLAGLAGSSGGADGTGTVARFNSPFCVAVDSPGNVYVADTQNNTVRKVTPTGVVTTLAGLAGSFGSADGTGSAARFTYPQGAAVDSAGNVYVADSGNDTIRKVTPAGVVTTLAGLGWAATAAGADGTGSAARFSDPTGVAVDNAGNVYVADSNNSTIRKVTRGGVVTTLAGLSGSSGSADGTGSTIRFSSPYGVTVDRVGNVYVSDMFNNTIRKGWPAPRLFSTGTTFTLTNNQFNFNLTGPSGQSVVVESSPDLLNWFPFWTNTFAGISNLSFTDSQSATNSQRFYRARLP